MNNKAHNNDCLEQIGSNQQIFKPGTNVVSVFKYTWYQTNIKGIYKILLMFEMQNNRTE